MTVFSRTRDVTGQQPTGGGGMDNFRTFLQCPASHKGSTTGALWSKKARQFVLCAKCNEAKSEARSQVALTAGLYHHEEGAK